jgi:plastocyanin
MTSRWHICFSLALGLPLAAADVSGTIQLVDSQVGSVRKQKDYSGVVVWLMPVSREAPLPAPRTYTIVQKGKRFLPHVLAIPVGATVDLPNQDPIFHNAFSNFAGQPFDTGLYPPGTTTKVRFQRPGIVRVFCNIHSTMSAVIAVLETPWFAITGRDGAFRITGVPPGEYDFHVWHERATEQNMDKLRRRIIVGQEPVSLGALTLSESGYVQVTHLNKYGKEYPPEPHTHGAYPGGRR